MPKRLLLLLLLLVVLKGTGQVPGGGLSLWLQADKGLSLQGSNISAWRDQSGQQHDAVTRTSDLPQLVPHALNGLPVIRFNGRNNGLETVPFISFPAKRGTLFLVAKINDRSSTSGVGVGSLVSTFHGTGNVWQFCASLTKYSFYDGSGSEGFPVSGSLPSEWNMVSLQRTADTLMAFYRGGRLERSFTINNNQPGINSLKIGYNGRLGGTATDSIPEVLNGEIAEIILYDRVLNEEELTIVHNYLSKKYSLALTPPPFWKRWWFYVLVILLLVLLAGITLLFINQRKLKKQLLILEKEQQMDKERQRISREMHDDIGAGLTQITLMSESAKNKAGKDSTKELDDIAETGRRLVSSMSEIIWSLNPENKTLEQLTTYLREQLNKQLEYSGIAYQLQFTEEGKDIVLSNEQRRNILLATKEIINNAIKYSGAKNILVSTTLQQQVLEFCITDDGCGFDSNAGFPGNGLKNIRNRIADLGGKLELQTAKGKGCCYRYSVPLV